MTDQDNQHVIKRIRFLDRENVPIFCQNKNGPCPLLALANVLALRNRLPVAELILDADVPVVHEHSEYETHLRANITDSLNVLGKLATGIDVNIRFDSPMGFEPTPEVAIFDLLGITLVHGWLVDPMDAQTTAALGARSYNEVVEMVVNAADAAAPPAASLNYPRSAEAVVEAPADADTEAAAAAGERGSLRVAAATDGSMPSVGTPAAAGAAAAAATVVPDLISFDDEEDEGASSGGAAAAPAGVPVGVHAGQAEQEEQQQQQQQHASGGDIMVSGGGSGSEDGSAVGTGKVEPVQPVVAAAASPQAGEPAAADALGEEGVTGSKEAGGDGGAATPAAAATVPPPAPAPPAVEEAGGKAAVGGSDKAMALEATAAAAGAVVDGDAEGDAEPPPSPPDPPPPSPPLPIPSYPSIPSAPPAAAPESPAQPASSAVVGAGPLAAGSSDEPQAAGMAVATSAAGEEGAAAGGSGAAAEAAAVRSAAVSSLGSGSDKDASVAAHSAQLSTAPTALHANLCKGAGLGGGAEGGEYEGNETGCLTTGAAVAAAPAVMQAPVSEPGSVALERGMAVAADGASTSAAYDAWQEAKRTRAAALLKDAALARRFLEATASQLTEHGLVAIQTTMSDNSLAVFFRNNHFSCMFKHEGTLYLLVTDQGYMQEGQVVWERLDSVDGNTQMCGPDFLPYRASEPPPRVDMAALSSLPPEALAGLSEADAAAIAEAAGAVPSAAAAGHAGALAPAPARRGHADTQGDAQLAALLAREEEEAAAAAALMAQQRRQQQVPMPLVAAAPHQSVQGQLQQLRAQHSLQQQQQQLRGPGSIPGHPVLPVSTPSAILPPHNPHASAMSPDALALQQQQQQQAYTALPPPAPAALPASAAAAAGAAPPPAATQGPLYLPPAAIHPQHPQQLQYVPELDQYLLPGDLSVMQQRRQQQQQQQPPYSSQADADADLALALHLQQQEEQEIAEAERRRQQQQARAPLHPQQQLLQQQAARSRAAAAQGRRPLLQPQPQPPKEDKSCAVM